MRKEKQQIYLQPNPCLSGKLDFIGNFTNPTVSPGMAQVLLPFMTRLFRRCVEVWVGSLANLNGLRGVDRLNCPDLKSGQVIVLEVEEVGKGARVWLVCLQTHRVIKR